MFAKAALGGIRVYQTYLSPRKGYRCAYSVHHGGTGCSGFAKAVIRDKGFFAALPDIRQRFRDCKVASLALRQSCAIHANTQPDDSERPQRRKRTDWLGWADACGFAACAGCGGSAAAQSDTNASNGAAGGGCDCAPDIGGCDCSPSCDCAPGCS